MFIMHRLITTANTQLGNLMARCRYLQNGVANGCPAADHCRNIMQFSFIADRIFGDFFSENMMREFE